MQYMDGYRASMSREERERQQAEREAAIRMKNNRLGIALFQGSWIMVFVCLIVVNWQLRYSPDWMLDGAQAPDALLPTLATGILLLSTALTVMAVRAIEAGQTGRFLVQWAGATATGVVFLLIMISQFFAIIPGGGQFVFVYRVMIGYHALHALAIGVMMVQVWRYGRRGQYHAENTWAVEATAKLWYFVTVAWLMFYVVLYLVPQP